MTKSFAIVIYTILFLVFGSLNAESSHEQTIRHAMCSILPEGCSELKINVLSGGITNSAYKIEGSELYFAKICHGSQNLIGSSLQAERDILSLISCACIAPAPIYYDPLEGLLITQFICSNQEQINLRDEKILLNTCKQLKKLHDLDIKFPSLFCPYERLETMLGYALQIADDIPADFFKNLLLAGKNWKQSDLHQNKKVPCHLDLHSCNLIEENGQIWLIDWEYAGQSDPYYDLAVLASGEAFNDIEMENLLKTYVGYSHPSEELKDHFWKMRILADARWALWCYMQAVISPLEHPFKEHGDKYLEESKNRLYSTTWL